MRRDRVPSSLRDRHEVFRATDRTPELYEDFGDVNITSTSVIPVYVVSPVLELSPSRIQRASASIFCLPCTPLLQHRQIEGVVAGAQVFSIGEHNAGTENAEFGLSPDVPKPLMGTQRRRWIGDL